MLFICWMLGLVQLASRPFVGWTIPFYEILHSQEIWLVFFLNVEEFFFSPSSSSSCFVQMIRLSVWMKTISTNCLTRLSVGNNPSVYVRHSTLFSNHHLNHISFLVSLPSLFSPILYHIEFNTHTHTHTRGEKPAIYHHRPSSPLPPTPPWPRLDDWELHNTFLSFLSLSYPILNDIVLSLVRCMCVCLYLSLCFFTTNVFSIVEFFCIFCQSQFPNGRIPHYPNQMLSLFFLNRRHLTLFSCLWTCAGQSFLPGPSGQTFFLFRFLTPSFSSSPSSLFDCPQSKIRLSIFMIKKVCGWLVACLCVPNSISFVGKLTTPTPAFLQVRTIWTARDLYFSSFNYIRARTQHTNCSLNCPQSVWISVLSRKIVPPSFSYSLFSVLCLSPFLSPFLPLSSVTLFSWSPPSRWMCVCWKSVERLFPTWAADRLP